MNTSSHPAASTSVSFRIVGPPTGGADDTSLTWVTQPGAQPARDWIRRWLYRLSAVEGVQRVTRLIHDHGVHDITGVVLGDINGQRNLGQQGGGSLLEQVFLTQGERPALPRLATVSRRLTSCAPRNLHDRALFVLPGGSA